MLGRFVGAGLAFVMLATTALASATGSARSTEANDDAVLAMALEHARPEIRNAILSGHGQREDFTIQLPPGTSPRLAIDWRTQAVEVAAVPSAEVATMHLGGSGCTLTTGFSFGNIMNPALTNALCTPQPHTTPITNSILACAGILSFCVLDGINFPSFAFLFMICLAPGGTIAATWGSTPTSSAGCGVFIFGSLPSTWTSWDAVMGKDAAGATAFGFHND